MNTKPSALGRFALTHLAAAAALSLAGSAAWGLGLGRLTVQSALGETLKAEIDISSLTPEEAGTLKVRVAPPEAYRATGVEYNAVLTSTQVQLVRRPDGRQVLRINSDRAVQEPFVDVILELSWASGRLVREYTLLFDPPSLARPAPPAEASMPPVAGVAPRAAEPSPVAAPRAAAPAPIAAASPAAPAPAAPRPAPAAAAPAVPPAPPAAPTSKAAASEYQVKPGDTLSRVAGRTKPAGISLDQMLVGLFRNNPDAFIGENMNRLKSGVVLQVPDSETVAGVSNEEARQVIQAQSADFAAYRQRLAGSAPELRVDEGQQRQAKGQVQAAVEDKKPAAAPSPDKLTLSKAGAAAASEAKLSKESEKKADAARVAELTRNVEELKKLSSEAKPGAKPAPAAASAAPAVPVAPLPSLPASVAPPAPEPAPAPAPAPVPAATPAPAPAPESPGLMAELMDNPLVLPIAGVLVALLGGLGLMRMRGKKLGQAKADTGFHESRLQPDSFFGATGGQRVDTRDAGGAASSMSYSLSQLDAIGDVDPVAEADVYLAYGRDLQAEEILKEALRANPERMAIRLKLLEVYAKRRDIKGFEQLAIQLYAETGAQGEDWAKAQELGRQIDADNPLYQPGGAPALLDDREVRPEPMNASTLPQTAQHSTLSGAHLATEPLGRSAVSDPGPPSGLDLDLDLDLGSPPAPTVSPFAMDATQALPASVEQAPLAMDFNLDAPPPAAAPAAGAELAFDLGDLDLPDENTQASTLPSELPRDDAASLDFDLSSIDLDLPSAQAPAPAEEPIPTASSAEELVDPALNAEFDSLLQEEAAADPLAKAFDALDGDGDGDPLQRQLELADEFRQIGDTEGARDVLQELLSKASGPLREKAQAMLDELR